MSEEIENERWEMIVALDEELLQGSVLISEFAAELVRNSDLCFASGAFVACLVMSGAAVETWLREQKYTGDRFIDLIEASDFDPDTKAAMHDLRRERNQWVHVDSPWEENNLEIQYSKGHPDLEEKCKTALRLLRTIVYSLPGV